VSKDESSFYDDLAGSYHLIFDDWDRTIQRQGAILSDLLPSPPKAGVVLDCACGIGTQSLALARVGYKVEGTDLSAQAVERARREAVGRGLEVAFRIDDMRELATSAAGRYGAVLALDNALPHLDSDKDVLKALSAMRERLRPQGKLLISLRDYAPLLERRPSTTTASLFLDKGRRRIVSQVWDWVDDRRYVLHLYITRQMPDGEWATDHFVGCYRAITLQEVAALAKRADFLEVEVLQSADTGYYQPIVTGHIA
jgi:glycine/sarcosine N-methyltransferase